MRASTLGLTILLAASAPALADDKAKAKKLYDDGLKSYNIAEYADAIKAWKEAYSLSKKSILLFNIGQAYRLDGDCKMAMRFYDTYQREEPNPKNQDELDAALALCAKAGDKPADKPPAGDKPSDKTQPRPIDKAPVADKAAEGSHEVAQPIDDGDQGEGEQVDAPASSSGGLRKIGIGVGVLGVVLGGVGIYFALDSKSAADENAAWEGEWDQTHMDIEARGESSASKAWILGGAGVAAIAAGAVMFAIGGPKATETSSVSVVPTRGGAAVGWAFQF
jgi:tetratricopeptide (TPR) repeat protein